MLIVIVTNNFRIPISTPYQTISPIIVSIVKCKIRHRTWPKSTPKICIKRKNRKTYWKKSIMDWWRSNEERRSYETSTRREEPVAGAVRWTWVCILLKVWNFISKKQWRNTSSRSKQLAEFCLYPLAYRHCDWLVQKWAQCVHSRYQRFRLSYGVYHFSSFKHFQNRTKHPESKLYTAWSGWKR